MALSSLARVGGLFLEGISKDFKLGAWVDCCNLQDIPYLGLQQVETLPSALSPINNQLTPIEPGIKAEPGLEGQLSPLAGLDDDAWYDGNTFQCMQCGFISRSLDSAASILGGI